MAQRAVGEARDALARAEQAAGALSARRAALDEAQAASVPTWPRQTPRWPMRRRTAPPRPMSRRCKRGLTRRQASCPAIAPSLADARAAYDGLKREAEARTPPPCRDCIGTRQLDEPRRECRGADRVAHRTPRRGRNRAAGDCRCAGRDRRAAPRVAVRAFEGRRGAQAGVRRAADRREQADRAGQGRDRGDPERLPVRVRNAAAPKSA